LKLKLQEMLLQMSDSIKNFDRLLAEVAELATSGEIEKALASFSNLEVEIDKFFSSQLYQEHTKQEVTAFVFRMNDAVILLQSKQKEIQNQVAAITQLGSNKVSKRYLTK
jgi:hypothetical protein